MLGESAGVDRWLRARASAVNARWPRVTGWGAPRRAEMCGEGVKRGMWSSSSPCHVDGVCARGRALPFSYYLPVGLTNGKEGPVSRLAPARSAARWSAPWSAPSRQPRPRARPLRAPRPSRPPDRLARAAAPPRARGTPRTGHAAELPLPRAPLAAPRRRICRSGRRRRGCPEHAHCRPRASKTHRAPPRAPATLRGPVRTATCVRRRWQLSCGAKGCAAQG